MSLNSAEIDLGFEPPLDFTGHDSDLTAPRSVNIRWLAGTVLTAVFGATLMGIAVMGTADRKIVRSSDLAGPAPDGRAAREKSVAALGLRRADKLTQALDIASAKRSFKLPTTIKIGDREIIKTRSYTRVSTGLLLTGSTAGDNLPAFNPLQLITEANQSKGFDRLSVGSEPNAPVSMTSADLATIDPTRFARQILSDEEAALQAREASVQQVSRTQPLSTPQTLLAQAIRSPLTGTSALALVQPENPFSQIEVRLYQENVSELRKSRPGDPHYVSDEQVVSLHKGESVEAALKTAGVVATQAREAALVLVASAKDHPVVEGDRLKLTFAAVEGAPVKSLVKLSLYGETALEAVIGQRDGGGYADVPLPKTEEGAAGKDGQDDDENALSVFNSIYETALRQGVPRFLIDELVRVYSYDVDFQRRVQGGDSIEFFYAEPEDGDQGRGELLYAAITLGNDRKQYYRFQTPDDNAVDFYDPQGRSARKFLLRMPLPAGQLRSGFGWRRHPILGYAKMHTGVDWANKVGTPILAAGNGTVIKAGWTAGYGNHVEIEHLNGYITTYSHMSAYGRGVEPGAKVRQGQVIGYLGATGLATGPHLHYEVIVNDNFVDPMAIKLPRGRELDGRMLADYRRERDRIDQLLKKVPGKTTVAQAN